MLKKIEHHIAKEKLFVPTQRILLAVSGGLDSMVMVHVFTQLKLPMGVAHANFQLRGLESDMDEQFVKQHCERLSVPSFSQRFDTNIYATQTGLSIQMAARELRYSWFDQIMKKEGYHLLSTAHHLSDSLETAILSLAKGLSYTGMLGIAAKSGHRIRPLLSVTRTEIEAYAKEHQLSWREDDSNRSLDYQRNFVRHHIVPKMTEINPSVEASFNLLVERAQGIVGLARIGRDHWKNQFWTEKNDRVEIDKKGFEDENHAAALLFEFVHAFGFSFSQCEDVIEALSGQPGKYVASPSHQLFVDRASLVLKPVEDTPLDVTIQQPQSSVERNQRTLHFSIGTYAELSKSKNIALLNLDLISFPLTWRSWHPGDFFYPSGMNGKKKISDFLIDQKISLADKANVSVLEFAGNVVWIVGHRIDNRYRATTASKQVLKVEYRNL